MDPSPFFENIREEIMRNVHRLTVAAAVSMMILSACSETSQTPQESAPETSAAVTTAAETSVTETAVTAKSQCVHKLPAGISSFCFIFFFQAAASIVWHVAQVGYLYLVLRLTTACHRAW